MNENDVLFQKVTQAYLEKKKSKCSYQESNLGLTPNRSTRFLFPSMPVSLSGIIHRSHVILLLEKKLFLDPVIVNQTKRFRFQD